MDLCAFGRRKSEVPDGPSRTVTWYRAHWCRQRARCCPTSTAAGCSLRRRSRGSRRARCAHSPSATSTSGTPAPSASPSSRSTRCASAPCAGRASRCQSWRRAQSSRRKLRKRSSARPFSRTQRCGSTPRGRRDFLSLESSEVSFSPTRKCSIDPQRQHPRAHMAKRHQECLFRGRNRDT